MAPPKTCGDLLQFGTFNNIQHFYLPYVNWVNMFTLNMFRGFNVNTVVVKEQNMIVLFKPQLLSCRRSSGLTEVFQYSLCWCYSPSVHDGEGPTYFLGWKFTPSVFVWVKSSVTHFLRSKSLFLRIKTSDKKWRFDGSMPSFSNLNKVHFVSSIYSEWMCEGLRAYD